ncbi:MAG: tyrosine-type recombinase/integrase [Rhodospirillales bacterium]|nr:tyrosine-type recombinase/integrase [Rhodospirillales bacterium]MBR9816316.1 tyrosine-type recombinase/integrase [Rhodospirillales bacterium]
MKLNLPGLLIEKLPSGNDRYRVRVEGRLGRRIRLHVGPDHKQFMEHYHAARAGIQLPPEPENPLDLYVRGSLDWLVGSYVENLEAMVEAGLASVLTLKQRRSLLKELCNRTNSDGRRFGQYRMDMPTFEIVKAHEALATTPGKADNMLKAVRAMYKWSCLRGITRVNPATGVSRFNINRGGARPWTVDDLRQYRAIHLPGTSAHLCITLFMFTACRISDAYRLGRGNEFTRDGVLGLGWQPQKKGSSYVEIPILPPLFKATRATTVQGNAYMLTEYGQPFKSAEGLRNRFKKWCLEADLPDLSSHGIRKAAGKLLAEEGCTQYEIMSVHGHAEAKTSETYTSGAERWRLARQAMKRLEGMEW